MVECLNSPLDILLCNIQVGIILDISNGGNHDLDRFRENEEVTVVDHCGKFSQIKTPI